MGQQVCSVEDCGKKHDSHGYCAAHVWRWKKYGDPLAGPPMRQRQSGPCRVVGCDRPSKKRGLCHRCDQRKRKGKLYTTRDRQKQGEVCKLPDCDEKPKARGWCVQHYHRWYRYGSPYATGKTAKIREIDETLTLEEQADLWLKRGMQGETKHSSKKDILTPWKQAEAYRREVYVSSGCPDATVRRGQFSRAAAGEGYEHLNSRDGHYPPMKYKNHALV